MFFKRANWNIASNKLPHSTTNSAFKNVIMNMGIGIFYWMELANNILLFFNKFIYCFHIFIFPPLPPPLLPQHFGPFHCQRPCTRPTFLLGGIQQHFGPFLPKPNSLGHKLVHGFVNCYSKLPE